MRQDILVSDDSNVLLSLLKTEYLDYRRSSYVKQNDRRAPAIVTTLVWSSRTFAGLMATNTWARYAGAGAGAAADDPFQFWQTVYSFGATQESCKESK